MSLWRRDPDDPRDGEWVKPSQILTWLAIIVLGLILLGWLL